MQVVRSAARSGPSRQTNSKSAENAQQRGVRSQLTRCGKAQRKKIAPVLQALRFNPRSLAARGVSISFGSKFSPALAAEHLGDHKNHKSAKHATTCQQVDKRVTGGGDWGGLHEQFHDYLLHKVVVCLKTTRAVARPFQERSQNSLATAKALHRKSGANSEFGLKFAPVPRRTGQLPLWKSRQSCRTNTAKCPKPERPTKQEMAVWQAIDQQAVRSAPPAHRCGDVYRRLVPQARDAGAQIAGALQVARA